MSVLIKDMEMPSCCDGCTFSDWSNLHQTASCKLHDYDPCFSDHSREYEDKRADFCPLVEISAPHGALIDRDALGIAELDTLIMIRYKLAYAQIVIEAEGSENHDD